MSVFTKRFPAGRWSLFGLGSETKWYSSLKERPRGEWDRVVDQIRREGTPSFPSHESVPIGSALCEEYSTCQTGTERLVVAEQSDPLFTLTRKPSIEILAQENLLQKYKERVEKLPQPNGLIKICLMQDS